MRMHADEFDITPELVVGLLATQCPQWADRPVRRVASSGTENALFRIGDDLVARLPRLPRAIDAIIAERDLLTRLAPHLPVTVPEPVHEGTPAAGFAAPWSVYRWLDGTNPVEGSVTVPFARDLARFVLALREIEPDGPRAGRGGALAARDSYVRAAIAELDGRMDTAAITEVWDAALLLPDTDEVAWLHGDLSPGNLLTHDGRLAAVIDFGTTGTGNPTVDLIPAWNLMGPDARAAFRAELAVDDVTWERGRAWALSIALLQLPYYWDTNPGLVANARYVVDQVLSARPARPRT
ncbi:aminoglycoside phosphotransferase family protein [Labedaea rhizosphaerae]|uniref:Aminoglycoside phosphotransferase (APT) family kinase protein n=1 Tax=Labedaea rhizosphaerae TaxID=598644 RepID=A0A4R6SJ76_LABRH|nr:aminoglycoside phosphotransferase family protein [Labedaea rhizosphaerae]TDQ00979.1 aminoglycoside phosphotransferase (APT) family kinase protein [Labedaea rhizosphaerae]